MTFEEALKAEFRLRGDPATDICPVLVRARFKRGPLQERGRFSLAAMMRDMQLRVGVEIGTNHGNSAIMWCEANKELSLTCIDPYRSYRERPSQGTQDDVYASACEAIKPYRITLIREDSLAVVDRFPDKSLDFIHIDGDHSFDAVMQDLIRWAPKVRRGGLVTLHDYCMFYRSGIVEAVNVYTHCHRIDPWYITHDQCPTAFWEKGVERV